MEVSPEKSKLDLNKKEFLVLDDKQIRLDFVERLIRFLKMNREDRFKAGIYIGNEGREWIDRSALHFPILDQDYYLTSKDENSTQIINLETKS
jgi:hypothetical protein